MKKRTRRLLGILLAAVMMMGLSVTSFASTHDVTVHIAKRDTRVNPYVVTAFSELPSQTITLTDVDSNDTLKDVVDDALASKGSAFSARWASAGTNKYLDAVTLNGTLYEGTYTIENYGTNQHKYTGTSWVWNYSGGSDYPSDYMNQATIGSQEDLYLFYETSEFIY